ncbi:MAG TPA: 4Fe-4S dicluster domain-containing protein [Rectinemataceae bacterium]|nr:4Fe-4S dicluster domain-containing protein [Rectinemataceae bacterium]
MKDFPEKREGESWFEKPRSRKDFLKMAGGSIAGLLVTVSLTGAGKWEDSEAKELRVWAIPSGVIVHDPSRCVGCKRCEFGCSTRNLGKVSAELSRIKVSRNLNYGVDGVTAAYAKADGQMGNFRIVAETCRQCEKPACGNACPMNAIYADAKTGARVVDAKRCVGCGKCVQACAWNLPAVDRETGKTSKCTSCEGDPTCAKLCPTGAIRYMDYKDAENLLWGADANSGATVVSGATA